MQYQRDLLTDRLLSDLNSDVIRTQFFPYPLYYCLQCLFGKVPHKQPRKRYEAIELMNMMLGSMD